jgi:hypothetical protein
MQSIQAIGVAGVYVDSIAEEFEDLIEIAGAGCSQECCVVIGGTLKRGGIQRKSNVY